MISYDEKGEVFRYNGKIQRGMFIGYGKRYRNVYEILQGSPIFENSFVGTKIILNSHHIDKYDLLFEHEIISPITFPHEWSFGMLKETALFHIDVMLELSKYNLILKDFHPWNIAFRYTRPVFLDFSALTIPDHLTEERFLSDAKLTYPAPWGWTWDSYNRCYYAMFVLMFIPYFLRNLDYYRQLKGIEANWRIMETTMNIDLKKLPRRPQPRKDLRRSRLSSFDEHALNFFLSTGGRFKRGFLKYLRDIIASINGPATSGYADYYAKKSEDQDLEPSADWNEKQKSVYEVFKKRTVCSVLDIAGNTGWFAQMIAKNFQIPVVMTDIDPVCVNICFKDAGRLNLKVTPCVADFCHPFPNIYGLNRPDSPMFESLNERISSDAILMLGIIHHLCLGLGNDFSQVIEMLNYYDHKLIVIEFVDIDDEKVVSDPDFFPSYKNSPHSFDWYRIDRLLDELNLRNYRTSIMDSWPSSRRIVIAEKSSAFDK